MDDNELSQVLDAAFPRCPRYGGALSSAGTTERPWWVCALAGYVRLAE